MTIVRGFQNAFGTPTIGAIETTYRGQQFRSRLEARWAVFFDEMGITWEYEPCGYQSENGRLKYLPDFWLPQFNAFWEVKPTNGYPLDKAEMLSRRTRVSVIVAFGPVGPPSLRSLDCDTCDRGDVHSADLFRNGVHWQGCIGWVECATHGALLGTTIKPPEDRPCPMMVYGSLRDKVRDQRCGLPTSTHGRRLHKAYTAARTHRFWEPTR